MSVGYRRGSPRGDRGCPHAGADSRIFDNQIWKGPTKVTTITFDIPTDFYESTDGKYRMDYRTFHPSTWFNAMVRVLDHVTGNEAISKGSTARAKDPNLSDEAYNDLILKDRQKSEKNMQTGDWGAKGNRAPRMPGATRLQQIEQMLLIADTKAKIAKEGLKEGEQKNTWLAPNGKVYTLEQWTKVFLSNAEYGAERKASIATRAAAQLAKEKADADARKVAKEQKVAASTDAEADPVLSGGE